MPLEIEIRHTFDSPLVVIVKDGDTDATTADAVMELIASKVAAKLRPVIAEELLPMSKEMDDLIVTAHQTMDEEDAAAAALQALSVLITNSAGDPAKASALGAELAAKRDALAAAIANTDPNAQPPAPVPDPNPPATA
jgi:hypothetical protein